MAKESGIAKKARELAEPFAEELGLYLWDVKFLKEGAEWYLRYFIDKDGGVNINDCENLSRAVDAPLDDADFIEQGYHLEVCSPGLCRELSRPEHFEIMMGEPVSVKLFSARDGVKEFYGILEEYQDGDITIIDENEQSISFKKSEISIIRLIDDIDL